MNDLQLHPLVRSATVSDSLDLLGIRNNAMNLDIKPLDRSMKISAFGIGALPCDYKGRMKVTRIRTEVDCGGASVSPCGKFSSSRLG